MAGRGVNRMEDPVEQEKIRRGPHAYSPVDGKHGAYIPIEDPKRDGGHPAYVPMAYPKVMDKTPKPDFADFKNKKDLGRDPYIVYEEAVQAWDGQISKSIVRNKDEEEAWLAAHPEPKEKKAKSA